MDHRQPAHQQQMNTSADNPEYKTVMYTTRLCGFCMMARRLLKSKGVDYEERPVDSDPELRQQMMELSGRRSVPQIFVGDTHLGGYDDIAALEREGKLDALLGLT